MFLISIFVDLFCFFDDKGKRDSRVYSFLLSPFDRLFQTPTRDVAQLGAYLDRMGIAHTLDDLMPPQDHHVVSVVSAFKWTDKRSPMREVLFKTRGLAGGGKLHG